MTIFETDARYVANTYKRFPVEIVSGHGSLAFDADGKEYIDLTSGIGVTSFGYTDGAWCNAVIEQVNRLQHTSNLYYTEPCARLAEALCTRTGMNKVFFSNSGAEANECAIKAARAYAARRKGDDCFTIATLENSFHGRTLTTLAATGQAKFHEKFQPLTPGFISVPANDFDAFARVAEEEKLAAVMIECVQGEGGVNVLPCDYVQKLASYAAAHDILLIVDEVQTGNGRTGKLYAYMHYDISPDIVSTAKGLAGGLPLGATLFSEKTADALGAGDHGSTFGGNPVCCAAALSVLERLNDEFLASVREKGEKIKKTLQEQNGIKSVSGMGMMIGVETEKPAAAIVNECLVNGVLCLTAHEKVRLLPALNISEELLDRALDVLIEACGGRKNGIRTHFFA